MKALLALVAIFLLAPSQDVKPDLSSPEAAMKSFLAAFGKADFVLAAKHLHAVEPSPRLAELAMQMKGAMPQVVLENVTTTPSGENRITLSAKLIATMQGAGRKEEQDTKIDLIKVGDEWKIVVPTDAALNSRDVLTSFTSFLANPEGVFANAKKAAQRAACLSNLKQVAMAAHMFVADNDDKLKVTGANVQAKLAPYLKNRDLWTCPLHSSGTQSYSVNGNIAGRSLAEVENPAETVMFYEGKNGALNYHHDGFAVVAFVDGHVKVFKKEAAQKLRWKP